MAERSKRGFASMSKEKQRQIASKGGKAAHAKGTAHEFTREEAVAAGRKGGKAAHAKGTAHQLNRPAGALAAEEGQGGSQSKEPNLNQEGIRANLETRWETAPQPGL
jgi:general stress protein YciG